jgi:hypothetical protein
MSRVRYVPANGKEPPLTALELEKLKGQQLANDISQTRLKRLRGDSLERREVKFVTDTMAVVLQQELMRLPSLVVKDLRRVVELSREQLFSIRQSVDATVRCALEKASDTLATALSPREAIAELVGDEQPSQGEIDQAARRKARTNAKRRERRKVRAKA